MNTIPSRDKLLFTPGPLTTSPTVKQAMLRDLGSRDFEFIAAVRDVRERLLALGHVDAARYTAILLQGSGTFGLEAVVSSVIPRDGKLLVAINGAYGARLAHIADVLGVPVTRLAFPEHRPVDPARVAGALADDPGITHVSCCHCETTSGVLNPIAAIGAAVRDAGRLFYVDAMSTFGAVDCDLAASHIDYLVSSANKCIEGVPGFSFVLARLDPLIASEGCARSVCLDLLAQHRGLERDGQFRFTPPTHTILAFRQALIELEQEGGVAARAARYADNHARLVTGMRALGFSTYLDDADQSYIITSFRYPTADFAFDDFYRRLNDRGLVIYPGKVGAADCFRIGSIGRLFPRDIDALVAAVAAVVTDMGVELAPAGGAQ